LLSWSDEFGDYFLDEDDQNVKDNVDVVENSFDSKSRRRRRSVTAASDSSLSSSEEEETSNNRLLSVKKLSGFSLSTDIPGVHKSRRSTASHLQRSPRMLNNATQYQHS
jgi:hypothetical protein